MQTYVNILIGQHQIYFSYKFRECQIKKGNFSLHHPPKSDLSGAAKPSFRRHNRIKKRYTTFHPVRGGVILNTRTQPYEKQRRHTKKLHDTAQRKSASTKAKNYANQIGFLRLLSPSLFPSPLLLVWSPLGTFFVKFMISPVSRISLLNFWILLRFGFGELFFFVSCCRKSGQCLSISLSLCRIQ